MALVQPAGGQQKKDGDLEEGKEELSLQPTIWGLYKVPVKFKVGDKVQVIARMPSLCSNGKFCVGTVAKVSTAFKYCVAWAQVNKNVQNPETGAAFIGDYWLPCDDTSVRLKSAEEPGKFGLSELFAPVHKELPPDPKTKETYAIGDPGYPVRKKHPHHKGTQVIAYDPRTPLPRGKPTGWWDAEVFKVVQVPVYKLEWNEEGGPAQTEWEQKDSYRDLVLPYDKDRVPPAMCCIVS